MMTDEQRRHVAEALGGAEGDLLVAPETVLEPYPAPFLRRHGIWQAECRLPWHPVGFCFGCSITSREGQGAAAYYLTGEPEAFVTMAKADGVSLKDGETAEEYAVAFLETTRDTTELFYLVRSVEDARLLPVPTDDEAARIAVFRDRYRPVIGPPAAAEAASGGFAVTVYAVRQQDLERHTVTVGPDGDLRDAVEVLESGLSLVYGA